MKVLKNRRNDIYRRWKGLTDEIISASSLTEAEAELIKISACMMQASMYGFNLHVVQALNKGIDENKIIDTILCCLPICGIAYANQALETLESIVTLHHRQKGEKNESN